MRGGGVRSGIGRLRPRLRELRLNGPEGRRALVELTPQDEALAERGAEQEPGESGSRDEPDEDGCDGHRGLGP